MGGRGKKRSASLVNRVTNKKPCSDIAPSQTHVDQTIDDVIRALNDSTDCDSEKLDVHCQLRIEILEKQVRNLKSVVTQNNDQIGKLTNQVSFLLSVMGLTEGEDVTLNLSGATGGIITGRPNLELSSGVRSSPENPVSNHGTMSYSQAVTKMRTAVVAAVHVESKAIQNRAKNFVISGLHPDASLSDKNLVQQFIAGNLGRTVHVTACKRLGAPVVGRVQRLLVTVETTQQASAVIDAAKILRSSPKQEIRNTVFINPDMTPAEQRAAFEMRCRRRSAKQRNPDPRQSSVHLQGPSDPPIDNSGAGSASGSVGAPSQPTEDAVGRVVVADAVVAATAAATDAAMDDSPVSSSVTPCGLTGVRPSVLSSSAPVFVPFVSSVPETTDGSSLPTVGAGRPGNVLGSQ